MKVTKLLAIGIASFLSLGLLTSCATKTETPADESAPATEQTAPEAAPATEETAPAEGMKEEMKEEDKATEEKPETQQ